METPAACCLLPLSPPGLLRCPAHCPRHNAPQSLIAAGAVALTGASPHSSFSSPALPGATRQRCRSPTPGPGVPSKPAPAAQGPQQHHRRRRGQPTGQRPTPPPMADRQQPEQQQPLVQADEPLPQGQELQMQGGLGRLLAGLRALRAADGAAGNSRLQLTVTQQPAPPLPTAAGVVQEPVSEGAAASEAGQEGEETEGLLAGRRSSSGLSAGGLASPPPAPGASAPGAPPGGADTAGEEAEGVAAAAEQHRLTDTSLTSLDIRTLAAALERGLPHLALLSILFVSQHVVVRPDALCVFVGCKQAWPGYLAHLTTHRRHSKSPLPVPPFGSAAGPGRAGLPDVCAAASEPPDKERGGSQERAAAGTPAERSRRAGGPHPSRLCGAAVVRRCWEHGAGGPRAAQAGQKGSRAGAGLGRGSSGRCGEASCLLTRPLTSRRPPLLYWSSSSRCC